MSTGEERTSTIQVLPGADMASVEEWSITQQHSRAWITELVSLPLYMVDIPSFSLTWFKPKSLDACKNIVSLYTMLH